MVHVGNDETVLVLRRGKLDDLKYNENQSIGKAYPIQYSQR